MNNWGILREELKKQINDCDRHRGASGNWSVCSRIYREVLNEMERIEDGTEVNFIPFNGTWKTRDEIDEMLKDKD